MACLRNTVYICRNSRRTYEYIAYADLAAAVTLSVVSGKTLNKHRCKISFSVHKYSVIRYKYVVKNSKCLHSSESSVSCIHRRTFQFTCITALSAHNHKKSLGIKRYGKRKCIILVIRTHCNRRHNKYLVRIAYACLMCFCTTYNYSIRTSFNYS